MKKPDDTLLGFPIEYTEGELVSGVDVSGPDGDETRFSLVTITDGSVVHITALDEDLRSVPGNHFGPTPTPLGPCLPLPKISDGSE